MLKSQFLYRALGWIINATKKEKTINECGNLLLDKKKEHTTEIHTSF